MTSGRLYSAVSPSPSEIAAIQAELSSGSSELSHGYVLGKEGSPSERDEVPERQPFRSMGFVSVIIMSALFAPGLPLVLL